MSDGRIALLTEIGKDEPRWRCLLGECGWKPDGSNRDGPVEFKAVISLSLTVKMNSSAENSWPECASEISARVLLALWLVLLVPWIAVSLLAGMAFDSGNTMAALLIVLSVWSYGPAVFAAFKLLRRSRKSVLLPFISILGICLGDFLAASNR